MLALASFFAAAFFGQAVAPRQLIQSAILHRVGLYGSDGTDH
jgi:hypothetical protein